MSEYKINEFNPKEKWYNHERFPLVPTLKLKKESEHNTSGFTFKWLFITIWNLDSPHFELSLVCSSHWGLGFVGVLLYVRWVFCIPFPTKLQSFMYRVFSRKSEHEKNN